MKAELCDGGCGTLFSPVLDPRLFHGMVFIADPTQKHPKGKEEILCQPCYSRKMDTQVTMLLIEKAKAKRVKELAS